MSGVITSLNLSLMHCALIYCIFNCSLNMCFANSCSIGMPSLPCKMQILSRLLGFKKSKKVSITSSLFVI